MSLIFKVTCIIYISESTSIVCSRDDAPFTDNKGTGPAGEGRGGGYF